MLLLVAAVRLLWTGFSPETSTIAPPAGWTAVAYLGCGLAMGLLSSLMGVGGGIILIPLLVAFFGYSQHDAAGTSLLVMIPIALLGAIRFTRSNLVDWPMGGRLGLGALVGAIVGASLALTIPQGAVRVAFALLLVVTAAQMLRKARRPLQVPS
jgi:uncharacterized membrane protein YfcA